ncbi:hypothetical protein HXX25_09690 [Hyphobacterium sp. CCMP332]|jgi:hypothetical protein|uniref:hypothetical protein n=1 Tax=Hyphobacterium sp. CCMP332 TaxID=2749086 RepID=UPI00164F760E|nr:hypothetical protein [Hyphobacterium sp. CCMP332]QNL19567.1 hypothetical protein HXX25_09690 [Hyphobacterium sp. CCMP332]
MAKKGKLSRRSFLASVAGGMAAMGAIGTVTGSAVAQSYTGRTDADSGSSADRAGYGRRQRTGYSDNDSGANADPANYGRRGTSNTNRTNVTDSDSGPNADRAGYGRGTTRNCSDRDSGSSADPAGRGRHCR